MCQKLSLESVLHREFNLTFKFKNVLKINRARILYNQLKIDERYIIQLDLHQRYTSNSSVTICHRIKCTFECFLLFIA